MNGCRTYLRAGWYKLRIPDGIIAGVPKSQDLFLAPFARGRAATPLGTLRRAGLGGGGGVFLQYLAPWTPFEVLAQMALSGVFRMSRSPQVALALLFCWNLYGHPGPSLLLCFIRRSARLPFGTTSKKDKAPPYRASLNFGTTPKKRRADYQTFCSAHHCQICLLCLLYQHVARAQFCRGAAGDRKAPRPLAEHCVVPASAARTFKAWRGGW